MVQTPAATFHLEKWYAISEDQPATVILCDNESVVKNTSNVESSLNKKYSAIAYNFSR